MCVRICTATRNVRQLSRTARSLKGARGVSEKPKNSSPIPSLVAGVGIGCLAYYVGSTGYEYLLGTVSALTIIDALGRMPQHFQQERRRKQAAEPSGVFGTARWATVKDCRDAGLTDPNGLYLGCLDGVPLFYNGKAHGVLVAPTRQGKGISVVIPNLLHNQGSMCVTDPKGELASVTAQHRAKKFGQAVYIVNPWGLHGLPSHRFNPFGYLVETYADPAQRRSLTEEVASLVLQLLPEPEGEKNRYFREGSRKILRALLLLFATRGDAARCNPVELWRVLQSPPRLIAAIGEMADSEALDFMLRDIADDLQKLMTGSADQFGDFREGASQTVSIFDPAGWLADSVTASDFSFADLKSRKATVYLVIPSDKIGTYGPWLGLLTRRAIDSVARTPGKSNVLFLLDEAANMGKLAGLSEALTLLPGLGVRVWFIVQALEQLENLYGRATTQVILSQAEVKQFFAVQSLPLAKQLSEACGMRTVKTTNIGLGRDLNDDIGESVSETGRPLISPEDVRALAWPKQLLFVNALPPIKADRVPYWEVEPWRSWAAPNPVEGGKVPAGEVKFKLQYKEKGNG